jgi:transposase InsO family protein
MDYLTIEPCKGGVQNILVMTDHFTKFAVAVPTRNQTAKTTADTFFHNFVIPYVLPKKIHSEQGANFMSNLLHDLCSLRGISKSRTTPYYPIGNGITERFNRTLISMLGTLQSDQKANWKVHIGPLVHAYNSTKHETTGFSPFYLMFGREPNLPIDLVFGLGNGHNGCRMPTILRIPH